MLLKESFFDDTYNDAVKSFSDKGYVILPLADRDLLDEFRSQIVFMACNFLDIKAPKDHNDFLNMFAKYCDVAKLNSCRLAIYEQMNNCAWLRPSYYRLASTWLDALLGNELAMQNKINLSIQLPNDDSSLLPIHADTFGGETPFQIVQWLPLVDCYGTKTMFIVPKTVCEKIYPDLVRYQATGMEQIFDDVKDELVWLNVPYGSVLIFSPNYLHGNVVNTEDGARWSMNCRLKGLFTPYTGAEKKLGSFYSPITVKPTTRLGLNYTEPSGFLD